MVTAVVEVSTGAVFMRHALSARKKLCKTVKGIGFSMSKFDLEEHITDGLIRMTLKEAKAFAELHGYTVRVVKKWDRGKWSAYVIKPDYNSKRINVAVEADNDQKIDRIEGLG